MVAKKLSHLRHSARRGRVHALALLCAVIMLVSVFPPLYTVAASFGEEYEGWKHFSNDATASGHITQDADTNALYINALNSVESLYLNREVGDGNDSSAENQTKFDKDTMTNFVIEFDMVIRNYTGKALVDGGNATAGSGSFGLAFMGASDEGLDTNAITAHIDYDKMGLKWYNYSTGAQPPKTYKMGYLDGKYNQYHFQFNNAQPMHVTVTKDGANLTMAVRDMSNTTTTFTSTVTTRTGTLPEAGYVGFVANGVDATVANVKVTNTTGGGSETVTFFTPAPKTVTGEVVDGWFHVDSEKENTVTVNQDESITVDALDSVTHLYLNHEQSSADNVSKFSATTNFTVEFDAVPHRLDKGSISLSFLGMDNARLDVSAITARIDETNFGFMWRDYPDIVNPYTGSWNYVGGAIQQWHWRFHEEKLFHVKAVKAGSTLTMTVTDDAGAIVNSIVNVDLPTNVGLPTTGYIGLLIEDANMTISNVQVTDNGTGTSECFFGDVAPTPPPAGGSLYDGWYHSSADAQDQISINSNGGLSVNVQGGSESFYLNHEQSAADNLTAFGKDVMTDFIAEFDAVANEDRGALSFAFLGEDGTRLDLSTITARVDTTNYGIMWRDYANITNPYSTTWSYVDGVIRQYHWRFHTPDLFHVRVEKSGKNVTMTVTDAQGIPVMDTVSVTLPDTLPASGYVGLLVEDANVVISNLKMTNTTNGGDTTKTFFTQGSIPPPPSGATGSLYEGWQHLSTSGKTDCITQNQDDSITVDAMGSANEFLYLNHENSSADNLSKFGKDVMKNFIIQFDLVVNDYQNRDQVEDGNLGAGGGSISLAFLANKNSRLDNDSITARIDYVNIGFMMRDYENVTTPAEIAGTYNYMNGMPTQWHWIFNNATSHRVKIIKEGNEIMLKVDNGAYSYSATIPEGIGLPESGYVGLMLDNVNATISNVQVTNTDTDAAETFFGDLEIIPELDPKDHQYEGWQHSSLDADDPQDPKSYITYDQDTHKLTFNALNSTGEMLYLNADTCPDDLLNKFGINMMQDFTIAYDIKLDKTGPNGGQIGFGFMSTDGLNMLTGAITAGHTNDHNCFWWRGYPGVQMPSEYAWNVIGYPDGFIDPSFKGTGRTYRVELVKEGWTISMSIDDCFPIEIDLPSDVGLPETGYMGFFACNANGTIGNVVVTNDTTGETGIFFGDGETDAEGDSFIPMAPESEINPNKPFDDIEGWSAFCNEQSDGESHYYQRGEDGALFFDGMDCNADFIYLNAEYTTSEEGKENRDLFGKDMMSDYTISFDFSLRDATSGMGSLSFVIQGANQVNPGYSSVVLTTNGTASALKYEFADINHYGLLPDCNPTFSMLGDTLHFVTIEKRGKVLTVYLDGFVAWEDVVLPEVVENNAGTSKQKLPDSGFVGFWFRNAQGYIANVKVTNETTGATKTYFEDFNDTIDFWKMGGGDTTNALAMTPEKGVGIHGVNSGEAPDNTMVKYVLPLELDGLSMTFVPKMVTSTFYDDYAWLGFALTDSEKDYNLKNTAKSSGFLAQIYANDDGSATVKFVSMLPDGDYGDHVTTATIEKYELDKGYTFGFNVTDGGVEVTLDGKKFALLDWLKGEVYGTQHYCFLTTTASCSDGFEQAWAVTTLNGENAVDYDSGLFLDEEDDWGDDPWGDDPWGDDPWGDDPWGDDPYDPESPETGDNSLLGLLIAFALMGCSAVAVKKLRKAA